MKNFIICLSFIVLYFNFCLAQVIEHDREDQSFWISLERPVNSRVYSLVARENGEIFAAMTSSGVYHTTNYGETWQHIDGLYPLVTYGMIEHYNKSLFVGNQRNIFKMTNIEDGWHFLFSGAYNCLAFTLDSYGYIYASCGHVYCSKDYGNAWDTTYLNIDGNFPI